MNTLLIALALSGVQTADTPTAMPDLAATRQAGEALLRARLIDPESVQITYTSGLAWGWMKPVIGKRQWGWVACGTYNARNRLGGYAGRKSFAIASWADGHVSYNDLVEASCARTPTAIQPEFADHVATTAPVDVADQLSKLAGLRDRGVLTPGEFEAQKAKLLAK